MIGKKRWNSSLATLQPWSVKSLTEKQRMKHEIIDCHIDLFSTKCRINHKHLGRGSSRIQGNNQGGLVFECITYFFIQLLGSLGYVLRCVTSKRGV